MNEQQQAIRDEQRKTWNKVSHGWKKWNEFTMNFLKPMGDAIIKALDIKSNDTVLDIASGTGEPAFSIAAIATNGKVYATDLSEEMLTIARTYAGERDISNIEFKVADVSDLPFKYKTPIATLRPGQRILCDCIVKKGQAKTHVKWRPVSTITFSKFDDDNYQVKFKGIGMMTDRQIIEKGIEKMRAAAHRPPITIFSHPLIPNNPLYTTI